MTADDSIRGRGKQTGTDSVERAILDVSGVSVSKAERLQKAGFDTVTDLRSASQSELAAVDGLGAALAARIKADVGTDSAERAILDVSGVSVSKAERLQEAGFDSITDIRSASRSELATVDGIGNDRAARIKEDVENEDAENEDAENEDAGNEASKEEVTLAPFSGRTHVLSIGSVLAGSTVLFLIIATALTEFTPFPVSINGYAAQFTFQVWGWLVVASAVMTSVSATFWYNVTAPDWIQEHLYSPGLTLSFGVLVCLFVYPIPAIADLLGFSLIGIGLLIGVVLLLVFRSLGFLTLLVGAFTVFYLQQYVVESFVPLSDAGRLLMGNLTAIGLLACLCSYGIGISTVGKDEAELKELIRTAERIDETLSTIDFRLFEPDDHVIPYRSATVAHIESEPSELDDDSVLALTDDEDLTGYADYYSELRTFAATLPTARSDDERNPDVQDLVGVVVGVEPTRMQDADARVAAVDIVTIGNDVLQLYARLRDAPDEKSNYISQSSRGGLATSRESLQRRESPTREDIEEVLQALQNLEEELELAVRRRALRARLAEVIESWATETEFRLEDILAEPARLPDDAADLSAFESRVSRARELVGAGTKLTEFRTHHEHPAVASLVDAVKGYFTETLSEPSDPAVEVDVVESAIDVSERVVIVADSHSKIPVDAVLGSIATRLREGTLTRDDLDDVERTVTLAEGVLDQVTQLRSKHDDPVVEPFVSEIESHLTAHLDPGETARLPEAVINEALTSARVALDHSDKHPEAPFDAVVEYLTERLAGNTLHSSDIDDIETVCERSETVLEYLQTVDRTHPSVHSAEWTTSVQRALESVSPDALESTTELIERQGSRLWEHADLMRYTPEEFEHVVASLYEAEGFETSVTQASQDLGIDVWGRKHGENVGIQVKQNGEGNTVGRPVLQKTVSAIPKGDADRVAVVTSSSFANTAIEYTAEFGDDIALIDGPELVRRLSESEVPPPE